MDASDIIPLKNSMNKNIKVDNMQQSVPDVRGRVERLYMKAFKTVNAPGEGVF